jgi:hypothetical protein
MFQYIQNDEDAYLLFLIFQRVMEEEKRREKKHTLTELYEKVDYEYYTTYVMDREVNQIEMDYISYSDIEYDGGYDGNDGYDN